MSKRSRKRGVHRAVIVEFNGSYGKAYIEALDCLVKIHVNEWRRVQGSWITNDPYRGQTKVGLDTQIVLVFGHGKMRRWAKIWGLAFDYRTPQAKDRPTIQNRREPDRMPPWQAYRQYVPTTVTA